MEVRPIGLTEGTVLIIDDALFTGRNGGQAYRPDGGAGGVDPVGVAGFAAMEVRPIGLTERLDVDRTVDDVFAAMEVRPIGLTEHERHCAPRGRPRAAMEVRPIGLTEHHGLTSAGIFAKLPQWRSGLSA